MNCFYHPQVTALGICRNCQKGLCVDCLVDLNNGLACKNRCEREVTEIVAMINRSKKAYEDQSDSLFGGGIFWGIIGAISILIGLNSQTPDAFFFFGFVFMVMAGWYLMTAFKNRKIVKNS
ncbi:MAG: hypothetical protein ABIQ35_07055 [Verrucomicrobiota bacterium]